MSLKQIAVSLLKRNGRLTTYQCRHRIASALSFVPLSLPRIIQIFGSDKQKAGQHSYGETYQRLFRKLRYRRIKILEIGILSGESVLAWRAYFPRAVTIGMDIEDKAEFQTGMRTICCQGEQGSAADLARVCAEGRSTSSGTMARTSLATRYFRSSRYSRTSRMAVST
jgi:hypothetical protein